MGNFRIFFFVAVYIFIKINHTETNPCPSPVAKLLDNWDPLTIYAEFDEDLVKHGTYMTSMDCQITLLDKYWDEIAEFER